jgi:hypothetical protein
MKKRGAISAMRRTTTISSAIMKTLAMTIK